MQISFIQIALGLTLIGSAMASNTRGQVLDRKITVNINNQELSKALASIEKTADITFVYSPALIPANKKVTLLYNNELLATVLSQLFEAQNIKYEVTGNTVVLNRIIAINGDKTEKAPIIELAQLITVTGKVTDEKGEPLVGVSVLVKGTVTGTTTDINGKYKINVADGNAVLEFKYIGYDATTVTVGAQKVINVSLSLNAKNLTEVVVVGYGTQKRADVTGAIGSIKEAALTEVPATNIIDQLKGRLAGVDIQANSTQPGAAGQIRIRGERSLATTQGNNDNQNGPLIILDGIPFVGGSINDINPDDIASLDVLKDASATAIYGSRGSNGVILITTKRGDKSGSAKINYNAYYGVSNRIASYNFFNGQEYANFKNQAALGNSQVSGSFGNAAFYADELTGLANGTNTDWQNTIFRQGYTTNNELSMNGGDEKTQYSLSGGYHKDQGITYGQDFTRYSLRSTIDRQVTSHVKIGLNTMEALSYNDGGNRYPVGSALRLSPLLSPYNADGSINLHPQAGSPLDNLVVNPLTIQDNTTNTDRTRRLSTFNSLYGEVKIIDGLKYRLNVGLTYNSVMGGGYSGPNEFYNTATAYSSAKESINNSENWSYTIENLLSYDKVFATKHHITLTGLYSIEKDHSQGSSFQGLGIPADYFQNYNFAQATSISADPGSFSERGLQSYMARLNYVFNGKYSLTATLRTDGSSVFPQNKYFTYPAAAAAWNIDREKFFDNISKYVSALKLRAGYGKTSSQNISPYSSLGALSNNFYNFGATGANGYYVTSIANQNLTWEFTTAFNLGLDFGLLHDRITGSIDVYDQRTGSILQTETLAPSNGANSINKNIGQTKGQGLEISLSSINIQSKKGFNWSTDFNISFNRDAIVSLHDGLLSDPANNWFVGQPFAVIYDVKKLGIWQVNQASQAAVYGQLPGQIHVQDVDNNGVINQNDLQVVGNFQPLFTGGITNRFSYKNVDLSIVTFARIGQKIIAPYLTSDGSGQGYAFFGQGRANTWKVDYWTPQNPTGTFPRPDAFLEKQNYASTEGIQDGSFVRVRSINLGYTFPPKLLQKAGIGSLRIVATVTNPFFLYAPLIKSGLGIDPEGNGYGGVVISSANTAYPTAGGGAASTGTSRLITTNLNNPSTRNFQIGVNLKF